MNRRTLLYLSPALGLGILLGVLGTLLFQGKAPAPAATAATTPSPTVVASTVPLYSAPPPTAPVSSENPEWDRGTVYTGGDKVLYQGRIFKAKWWTQGEEPGRADVWEDTKEAPTPVATSTVPIASMQPVQKPTGFKVVGYYPSWKPGETAKPRYDVLTHINYAFAIPTAEGGLRPLENPDTAKTIIRDAHANGVKVLLAVGGWSYNDTPLEATFVSATATASKREAFANAIVAMCDAYGFDGVDMDWEHPRVDGSSAAQYEAFMLTLTQKLHGEGKLLSSAVLGGATADGNVYYDAAAHSDKVLAAVDYINVMAYDGGDGERHSQYQFAVDCGSYWNKTRGVPADKVVLGLPFYARPSWAGYGDILAAVPNAWQSDKVQYNGMEAWYNGPETIRAKTAYAKENLGGVMIWEVTQDTGNQDKSLQTAIAAALGG